MAIREDGAIGIYIHIPFCVSKCPYCNFSSTALPHPPQDRYIDCVLKELSCYLEEEGLNKRRLETLYIGGGTPSVFSPEAIARLIGSIKKPFDIPEEETIEVTIEVNPDTAASGKLKAYRQGGVNRLSIGMQSFSDAELKSLGRTHSAKRAVDAFFEARSFGFDNIGLDLIFGLPGQSKDDWERSVIKAAALRPEHISIYGLTIEEGTPFHKIFSNRSGLPSDEEEAVMYESAVKFLKKAGYLHYEISNFALPGKISAHNSGYWADKDYLGLGASAHSYISSPGWGRRWWNESDASVYMERVEVGGEARAGGEALKRDEAVLEALMLGLRRLDRGIDGRAFKSRFGSCPKDSFKRWGELKAEGLLKGSGEDILLTPKGALLSNEVFLRLSE